jgi:magnesium chelatase subunit D
LQSRRADAIQRVLRLPQGHATPLAHGLFLAQQQVRQLRGAGRVARGHIRLVVATDGRGNVPLAASLQPEASPPPYRAAEAHADALRLAAALGEMRVQAVVLDPAPEDLPALPAELAAALGALLLPVEAGASASEP